jgi:hypothetical protein
MSEWKFIETSHAEEFCRIEYFGVKKVQEEANVEFVVTVREYVAPPDPAMCFFAQADKEVNQQTLAYTPCGWGKTSNEALRECIKAIRKFPYEPR